MKIVIFLCTFLLCLAAHAKSKTVEVVFQKNKVKLSKTEITGDHKTYYVTLPFDPNVGKNSNRLEAEIASANGCKSFSMISNVDKVKVVVDAKKEKGACSIAEEIQPLHE
jgi:hypothetical protein